MLVNHNNKNKDYERIFSLLNQRGFSPVVKFDGFAKQVFIILDVTTSNYIKSGLGLIQSPIVCIMKNCILKTDSGGRNYTWPNSIDTRQETEYRLYGIIGRKRYNIRINGEISHKSSKRWYVFNTYKEPSYYIGPMIRKNDFVL